MTYLKINHIWQSQCVWIGPQDDDDPDPDQRARLRYHRRAAADMRPTTDTSVNVRQVLEGLEETRRRNLGHQTGGNDLDRSTYQQVSERYATILLWERHFMSEVERRADMSRGWLFEL